mgnify:FL=1
MKTLNEKSNLIMFKSIIKMYRVDDDYIKKNTLIHNHFLARLICRKTSYPLFKKPIKNTRNYIDRLLLREEEIINK